jgi:hypothetical protein
LEHFMIHQKNILSFIEMKSLNQDMQLAQFGVIS